MTNDLNLNLYSKHYNDVAVYTNPSTKEPASKILGIDLRTVPYNLFTKNHSDLTAEEVLQISKYFGIYITSLIDVGDRSDKIGVAYLAELFAFNCFNKTLALGLEVSQCVHGLINMIPDNDYIGAAYNMSGCNDNNHTNLNTNLSLG